MTTSAKDGSPSPSPDASGGDQESGDMAENPDRSESKPLTNGKGDGIVQNGQPSATAVPNAKDPLRPRRKKAKRACFACQRAHLTCGMPHLNCLGLTLCRPSSHCFLCAVICRQSSPPPTVPHLPPPLYVLSLPLLF